MAHWQHLRFASCHLLVLTMLPAFDVRPQVFYVAGPVTWNLLPYYLRDPTHSFDSFCRDLKTSRITSVHGTLEALRLRAM